MGNLMDVFNLVVNYTPFRKNLGYFGWTGMGNLGDEALFAAVKDLLQPNNVMKHLRMYKRGKFIEHLFEEHLFGAMFLGAGTLINSSGYLKRMKALQERNIRTFVFGTGVLDPNFHSQFPNWPNCMKDWIEVLYRCEYVSVRGPLSKKILKEYGYNNAIISGDPTLFFADDVIQKKKGNKTIGINVGTTLNGLSLWGGSDQKVIDFVKKLCEILISKGYRIILFPVWIQDIAVSKILSNKLGPKSSVVSICHDHRSYMKAVKTLDLFIGEKLHSVILALCTYTPSIMLSYTPKGEDFMASVNLMDYSIRTDALNIDLVLNMIENIENGIEGYQEKLFLEISTQKNKLKNCADKINRILL